MTGPSVEVIGADRLASTLRRASDDLADLAPPRAGTVVTSRARSYAPKRSGRLAGSLHPARDGTDVLVVSSLVYAPVIHNGWPGHNITANPFGARALHDAKTQVTEAYTEAAQEVLGHVKGA